MSSSTFSHICGWKNYIIQAEGSSESHLKKDTQTNMYLTISKGKCSKEQMAIH